MFLTILFAAALASAFVSAAAAVIVAAAGANPVSYRISVLVGSGVGIAFGIASIYLVSFVGAVAFFIAFLLPAQFDAMASIFVLILLDIARAALAGTAVAAVAGRSSLTIRRGALIGAGFGLLSAAPTGWPISSCIQPAPQPLPLWVWTGRPPSKTAQPSPLFSSPSTSL